MRSWFAYLLVWGLVLLPALSLGDAPVPPTAGAGGSPSGAAGGDLSGSYPTPEVVDDSHEHNGSNSIYDDVLVVDDTMDASDFATFLKPFLLESNRLALTDRTWRGKIVGIMNVDATDFHIVDYDDTGPVGTAAVNDSDTDQEQATLAYLIPMFPSKTYGATGNATGFPIVDNDRTNRPGYTSDVHELRLDFDLDVRIDCSVALPTVDYGAPGGPSPNVDLVLLMSGGSYIGGGQSSNISYADLNGMIRYQTINKPCHSTWGHQIASGTAYGSGPIADPDELVSNYGVMIGWMLNGIQNIRGDLVIKTGFAKDAEKYTIPYYNQYSWSNNERRIEVNGGLACVWAPSGGIGGGTTITGYCEQGEYGILLGNPTSGPYGGAVGLSFDDGDDRCADGELGCNHSADFPLSGTGPAAFRGMVVEGYEMNNWNLTSGLFQADDIDTEANGSPSGASIVVGSGYCVGTDDLSPADGVGDAEQLPCVTSNDCIPRGSNGAGTPSGTCTAPRNTRPFKGHFHVGHSSPNINSRGTLDSFAAWGLGPAAVAGTLRIEGEGGGAFNSNLTHTGEASNAYLIEAHPDASLRVNVTEETIPGLRKVDQQRHRVGPYPYIEHDGSRTFTWFADDTGVVPPESLSASHDQSATLKTHFDATAGLIPRPTYTEAVDATDVVEYEVVRWSGIGTGTSASQDCDFVLSTNTDLAAGASGAKELARWNVTSFTDGTIMGGPLNKLWQSDGDDNVLWLSVEEGTPGGDPCGAVRAQISVEVFPRMTSIPVTPLFACNDGLDNDGDGLVDHPTDTGCVSTADTSEYPVQCADGIDNDEDGFTDFSGSDPECADATDTSEYD